VAGELDTFRVSPTTQGTPKVDAPQVENYNPKQLGQFGDAVSRAGAQAQGIYLDVLQRANQTKVDDAANQLKEAELDLTFGDDGYTRKKGGDALFRPDGKSLAEEYGGTFGERAQQIAAGLSNDAQREAFNKIATGMSTSMRSRVESHTGNEFVEYSVGVKEGLIQTRNREIALNGGDPEVTRNAITSIRAATYELAQLTGNNSGEAIEALTRKALTPGLVGAMKSFLDDNDVSAAEKYMDLYKEYLTPEALLTIDAAIGEAQDMQVTTQVVNEILGASTRTAAAAAPQPLIMPVRGNIGGAFGTWRGTRTHKGLDLSVPTGTAVAAPMDGVARRKNDPNGYGQYYEIVADDGKTVTRLAHLSAFGVADGERVRQGQIIGKSGGAQGAPGAGNSKGPHVHYEVRINGKPVDPTGSHSTTGSAGGGGSRMGSLLEMLQQARSDPRLTSDPKRLGEAERQIRSMYSAHEESERNRKEDTINAAYTALAQAGGEWSKVPASVRSRVEGSDLPGLMSFGRALQQPAENANPDLGTYGQVRAKIAAGEITDPNQILRYAPALGRSLTKQLIDDVTGIKKGDTKALDSVKTVKDVLSYVEPSLKQIGIDEKEDPEEFIKFRGKLLDRIRRDERLKGKPLTSDEANQIASSMLATTATKSTGIFGRGLRGYELGPGARLPYRAIPASSRNAIEQSLIRRGVKPTQDAVAREYNAAAQAAGDQ
jgi:soluble lytic murein transglycosylase